VTRRKAQRKMEGLQMEAPAEGEVAEWQDGMEASGPVPLNALEVRRALSQLKLRERLRSPIQLRTRHTPLSFSLPQCKS